MFISIGILPMLRFAFFVGTCGVILMAMGVVPKPSNEALPDFSIAEIDLPAQPAFLAEIGALKVDLPALGERIEARLTRSDPKPVVEAAKLPEIKVEQVSQAVETVLPVIASDVVNFDLDDAELDAQAQAQLSDFATWLIANPTADIRILGHTDLTGPEDYNDALGKSRAEQVAAFLLGKGVEATRISVVKSYGESAPMVKTEEKSRENRRVKVETVYRL